MQRITNCILRNNDHILLLKKPSHGWYAMPGGKMELKESIKESVVREYREETGLILQRPDLRGVFSMIKVSQDEVLSEWMMFTFICDHYQGRLVDFCDEGELEWVPINKVLEKPMAPSDKYIHQQLLYNSKLVYGSFEYTQDYDVIKHNLD